MTAVEIRSACYGRLSNGSLFSYKKTDLQNKTNREVVVVARKRNPKTDEAEKLFRKGLKLKDIASALDVPEGTVRRWKNSYKWDSERSE